MRARALLLLAPLLLLGAGRGGCAGIVVLSPRPETVLLAPDVEVSLFFHPPVSRREALRVVLEAGLDAPGGAVERDLGADLRLARDRRRATLRIEDLPPGRSRLVIERRRARVTRVLDRGGFFPDGRGPFGADLHTATLRRLATDGAPRDLEIFVWHPAADAAALPTLVFSHGDCGLPTNYALLLSDLARAGFVAAAATHPGNSAHDPDCDSIAARIASFVERPLDLVAVTDWLLDESANPASPLAGAIDPERIALAGHSFGALAAVLTLPIEPRARAALLLAPVYAPVAFLLGGVLPLPVPVMLQVGEDDATTPPASDARPLYAALAAPRFLVELAGAGHPVFEDGCAEPLPGVCPEGGHASVRRFALGFLGRYLAGDRRWEALLAPAPGALLTADP